MIEEKTQQAESQGKISPEIRGNEQKSYSLDPFIFMGKYLENLATKSDLEKIRGEMKEENAKIRGEMREGFARLEGRIDGIVKDFKIWAFGGIGFIGLTLLTILAKLFAII